MKSVRGGEVWAEEKVASWGGTRGGAGLSGEGNIEKGGMVTGSN